MAAKNVKMHDLARDGDDHEAAGPMTEPSHPVEPKYHYGMRINAGHHELERMGIDDNVKPGDVYHLRGHATVVDSREDPETGERSASFHFTHMADAEQIPEDERGKSVGEEIRDAKAASDLKREGRAHAAEERQSAGRKDDKGETLNA